MFNARLLGNGRYRGNRQPHHCDHIRDTIGCDHPIFIQMGPLVSELYHFQHFPTWWPSAILNLKYFHIWSRDCHWVPNLLFCIKFHQNWIMRSAPRRPQLLNVQCAVAKQRLLPQPQPQFGNRIMARTSEHDGMRLPKFHPNRSIGEWVIVCPTFSNMAAVRHLEF